MKIMGVIPARLGSTRLSEKVLSLIQGRPMIQHVWERARQAKKLSDLIIACDDRRVEECVRAFGGKALMTRQDHANGTSRVAEVAEKLKADVYINIQGDEPLIHPAAIDQLAGAFESDPQVETATLAVRRRDPEGFENPNVVKVVCDCEGYALYFSRSPIPCHREKSTPLDYLKHLGIYGYRRDFLLQFVGWDTGELEDREKLEQLRILEKGFSLCVVETAHDSLSVDTAGDLEAVEAHLKNQEQKTGVS